MHYIKPNPNLIANFQSIGTHLTEICRILCFKMRKYVSNTAESASDCIILRSLTSGAKEAALKSALTYVKHQSLNNQKKERKEWKTSKIKSAIIRRNTSSLIFVTNSCLFFFLSLSCSSPDSSRFFRFLFFLLLTLLFSFGFSGLPRSSSNVKYMKT